MITRIAALVFFIVAGLTAPQAQAALMTISGAGTFGSADSPDPAYLANAPFAFSFQVENPLDDNPTYNLVNATYTVNGVSLATPIVVQFFSVSDEGLFALGFDNGGSLSLSGPDIGSTGIVASGNYQGAVYGSAEEFGSASVAVSVGTVPLPSSVALFGGGLLLIIVYQSRRRVPPLAAVERQLRSSQL